MDHETLVKAFKPFFTTKAVGKGTGLGLGQVYGFALQAGGAAEIISQLDEGTTVRLSLPASDEQPPRETPGRQIPMPDEEPRGTVVLVVEDEPSVLKLAVETLDDLGYVTVAAPCARGALEQLDQADRVDVLFTDMVMPGGMNGLRLSMEARRLRPGIKVLLTSGYTGLSATDLPADTPLLAKPYDRHQLSAQLEAVLER